MHSKKWEPPQGWQDLPVGFMGGFNHFFLWTIKGEKPLNHAYLPTRTHYQSFQ